MAKCWSNCSLKQVLCAILTILPDELYHLHTKIVFNMSSKHAKESPMRGGKMDYCSPPPCPTIGARQTQYTTIQIKFITRARSHRNVNLRRGNVNLRRGPLLQTTITKKFNLKNLIPKRYAIKFCVAQSYITLWAMSRNILFRFVSHLLYLIPKIPYGIHLAPTSVSIL